MVILLVSCVSWSVLHKDQTSLDLRTRDGCGLMFLTVHHLVVSSSLSLQGKYIEISLGVHTMLLLKSYVVDTGKKLISGVLESYCTFFSVVCPHFGLVTRYSHSFGLAFFIHMLPRKADR